MLGRIGLFFVCWIGVYPAWGTSPASERQAQQQIQMEVQQMLRELHSLRGRALAHEGRFFRKLSRIRLSQAAQPAELRSLGYSIVEVLPVEDQISGPEIRAQFADASHAVEVVFPAQMLLDVWFKQQKEQSIDRAQTHRFLVGQDGKILERAAQSWQVIPAQGCEVISTAVRYLLSGHTDPKTVLTRSCDGGRALATLNRLGVLPYAWVLEERVHQPEEQVVELGALQGERGLFVPIAGLFIVSVLSCAVFLLRARRKRKQLSGTILEDALGTFVQTSQAIVQETEFQQTARVALPRSPALMQQLGQLSICLRDERREPGEKRKLLLQALNTRLRELGVQVDGLLFFDYNAPTRELDWSQSIGNWGLRETALASGFSLSYPTLQSIQEMRRQGVLPRLENDPSLLQWWMDETRGQAPFTQVRLQGWFFWPHTPLAVAEGPQGLLVVRTPAQVVFSPRQEKEAFLFLRELENLWTTGESSPYTQESPRLDQREVRKE